MKAFLYAYDKVNMGDDLFIRMLVSRYSHVNFYIWSDSRNKENFSDLKNLTVIDKNAKEFKIISKIRPSLIVRYQEKLKKKCDAVIYIGGSIFTEYPTWKNIVNWWTYQAEHYNFYVIGANFGPYQTEEYRQAMDDVFSKMQDVCFRDQYSYNLFKDNQKVRMAPDIIFSYPLPKVSVKKRQIFISVINCQRKEEGKFAKYREGYEKIIREIMKYFLDKEYIIKLVSFCTEEGDKETVNLLKQYFVNESVYENIHELYYEGYNYKEIIQELAESEGIIATRFHAIVLGLLAQVKTYPIIYSDKSTNMLHDLGYIGRYTDLRRMDFFSIESVNKEFMNEEIIKVDQKLIDECGHFLRLDKELKTSVN